MINAIIIDDEPIIRNGLKKMIPWENHNISIAGSFSNGNAALEFCKSNSVDLAITDIKMPVMDGITFMKECRKVHPAISYIVLSSYSDFEYVKESARIGIENYLLKPIDIQEMNQTLEQLKYQIEEKTRRRESIQQGERLIRDNLFFRLITGNISIDQLLERSEYINIPLNCSNYRVGILKLYASSSGRKEKDILESSVDYINRRQGLYAVADVLLNMICILFWENTQEADTAKILQDIMGYMKAFYKVELTAALGLPQPYIMDVFHSFNQANRKVWTEIKAGEVSVWNASSVFTGAATIPFIDKEQMEELNKSSLYYQKSKVVELSKEILFMNRFLYKENYQTLVYSLITKIAYYVEAYLTDGKRKSRTLENELDQVFGLQTKEEVNTWALDQIDEIYEKIKEPRQDEAVIDQVISYIMEKSSEDINLNILGEHFYMNPIYLGRLIKAETGMSFNVFLNKLRIDQGREMLMNSNLSAKQIAEKLGYSNDKYFSSVFKKSVGCTPMEYREKLSSEK